MLQRSVVVVGPASGVSCLWRKFLSLKFRVQGLGFRVLGSGFRV